MNPGVCVLLSLQRWRRREEGCQAFLRLGKKGALLPEMESPPHSLLACRRTVPKMESLLWGVGLSLS